MANETEIFFSNFKHDFVVSSGKLYFAGTLLSIFIKGSALLCELIPILLLTEHSFLFKPSFMLVSNFCL